MPIELRVTGETAQEVALSIADLLEFIQATEVENVSPAPVAPAALAPGAEAPPPPAPPAPVAPVAPIVPVARAATIVPTVPAATIVPAATAVPVAIAPVTVVPPVGALPAAAIVLDCEGLPHDPRIHAKEPKFKTDGAWRGKRNLKSSHPGMLEQVTAELRLIYPDPRLTPAPVVPPAPIAPAAPAGAAPPTVTVRTVLDLAAAILTHPKGAATTAQLHRNSTALREAFVSIGLPEEHNMNDLLARPELYGTANAALLNVATQIGLDPATIIPTP